MRSFTLALLAISAMALTACPDTSKPPCGPASCTGCCDSSGACVAGVTLQACGAMGVTCTACSVTDSCSFGKCTPPTPFNQGGGSATGGGFAGGGGGTGGGSVSADGGAVDGGLMMDGGSTVDAGTPNPCAGTLTSCNGRCLDLTAELENCGACGRTCGQGEVCNRGRCAVLPDDCTQMPMGCGSGFYCDPVSKKCMTGCRLTADCPMGASCSSGTCSCPTGQHACGQTCVPDDATSSCGTRCSVCAQPANSTSTCSGGACGFTCATGYAQSGTTCVDIDECSTNNGGCSASATCTNTPGARTCACNAGFSGDGVTCTDINECATNNGGCANEATCTNTPGARTCACNGGYTGDGLTCADINECATNNGGCSTNGTCANTPGSRTCTCATGFTGDGLTCADINECLANNGGCSMSATCTNTPGTRTCACNSGFMGDGVTCADVDECATNNGGCAAQATCANTVGSRTCTCNSGYQGTGVTCVDVNECLSGNGGCAATGGVCTNTQGSRTCACATGFTGDGFTCADVDECATNNGGCAAVASGGVCTNTQGSRTCACASGFTGTGLVCTDIDECATNNGGCAAVASGGVCVNTPGSRTCACASGFTGTGLTCADIDECATNNGGCASVASGGVCTNTPGSRTCSCAAGTTGTGLVCTPSGNTCAFPAPVTLGVTANGSTAGQTNDFSGALSARCASSNVAGPDVVHVFTPTVTSNYRIVATASGWTPRFWVSTTCGSPAACITSDPQFTPTLPFAVRGTAGVPLYIHIDSTSGANQGSYALTVTQVAAPANDTCAAATPLVLGTNLGDFANATDDIQPGSPCSTLGSLRGEVIHSFTPPTTGRYAFRETTGTDVFLWMSTACNDTCTRLTDEPEVLQADLVAGTPVFIFVEPYYRSSTTNYSLTVEAAPVPANDTCATPQALTSSVTVNGTTIGANNDFTGTLSAVCSPYQVPAADVVYSFTAPAAGNYRVTTTPTTSGYTPRVWTSPTCGAPATCVDGDSQQVLPFTMRAAAGSTTFVHVDGVTADQVGAFSIGIAPITAPANDECTAPTPMTLNVPVTGDLTGAVDDLQPSMCMPISTFSNGDLVYTFTPATTGTYRFIESSPTNTVFWVATACNSSCVGGTSNEDLSVNLTAGITYFVILEPFATPGPFNFVVTTPPYGVTRPATACVDLSAAPDVSFTLGTGAPAVYGDDMATGSLALPFAFSFFGQPVSFASYTTNGLMELTSAAGAGGNRTAYGAAIPNSSLPNNFIAAYWDDMNGSAATMASLRTLTTGTAPNRRFTVQWANVAPYTFGIGPERLTFQVQLVETSNVIEFHYCSAATNGGTSGFETGATGFIGLEDATGSGRSIGVSANTAGSVSTSQGYRFTPQ
ncbi:MAG: EGF domain-containing protein [Myxococcaceae bacterium]